MKKSWNFAFLILWVCFAFIFGDLAYKHYNLSKQTYPKFVIEVPQSSRRMEFDNPTATETAKKFEDFMKQFNAYIDDSNKHNSSANIRSFGGYLAACLTALVSAFMAFMECIVLWKNRETIDG